MKTPGAMRFLRFPLFVVGFFFATLSASLAQDTSLTMTSQPGDYIGAGVHHTYTLGHGTFAASRNIHSGVSISFNSPTHHWTLDFAAPAHAPFVAGTYSNATRYPLQDLRASGLTVSGDGRSPNTVAGSFVVKKIIYGPEATITSFWATFTQSSNGAAAVLTGEIKFNADATGTPVNQAPGVYAGVYPRVSTADTVALSGLASDDGLPNAMLTAVWAVEYGPGTVQLGNAGALQTTAKFNAAGTYFLSLTVNDGVFPQTSLTSIEVYDPAILTSLTMTGQQGDKIGLGATYSYTLANGSFDARYDPYDEGISVTFRSPNHSWDLRFVAPLGAPLKTGTYAGASRAAVRAPAEPGLDVSGDGRGATTLTGSFEIKKVIYGAGGAISAFWATFIQHSDGSAAALTGEIKFNAGANDAPVNQRPGVDAGPDQAIPLGTSVPLAGLTDDDGLPGGAPVTTWSLVSGPGTVQFADAHALQTTATFSSLGSYILKLTSSDGALTGSDQTRVAIFDPAVVTTLKMTSEPGDEIGRGLNYFFSIREGDLAIFDNYANGVSFSFRTTDQNHTWYLDFAAPDGAPLQVGTYSGAERFQFQRPGTPGLAVTGDDRRANTLTGSFEIRQIAYRPDGSVAKFWATFVQYSNGSAAALRGEIKFNVDAPANTPPKVYAGKDRVVLADRTIQLGGTVTDDGLPQGQTITSWRLLRGPGTAIFGNSDRAATTVRLSAPGVYVLRLIGFDGVRSAGDDLELIAVSPSGPYSAILAPLQPGGTPSLVSVNLTQSAATGVMELAGKSFRFSGKLDNGGFAQIPLKINAPETLQLTLRLQVDPAALVITLAQGASSVSATALASERAVTLAKGSDSSRAGFYTVAFSTSDLLTGSTQPFGYGWAGVSKSGSVDLLAVLPDQTLLSDGAAMACDGSFVLYDASRAGHAVTAGKVQFENLALSDLDGSLSWAARPGPTSAPSLPSALRVIGSRYVVPLAGQRVLNFGNAVPNGRLVANSPGWFAPLFAPFTLSSANAVIPQGDMTLQIVPRLGAFAGQISDPNTKRRLLFSGVVLQKARAGYGAFSSPGTSGSISLVPIEP